ncbi:MAG: response regulator transcription factor [Candidatus Accumulibacter sp.]|nr:response regulator transcription factor [Accumulibacter sp.]
MRIANLEDEPELAATVCEWLRATAWEVEHFDSGVA